MQGASTHRDYNFEIDPNGWQKVRSLRKLFPSRVSLFSSNLSRYAVKIKNSTAGWLPCNQWFLQAGRIRRAECYFSLHDLLRSMTELINKTSQTKTMQKFRPRNDLDLLKQLCSSKVLVCSVLLNTLSSLCIKVFINYLVIPKERFFLRFASVTNKCFS